MPDRPADSFVGRISTDLSITRQQVAATVALLDEGGTIPFIARYRKEQTGSLDEVAVTAIRDRLAQLTELEKRRDTILKSLDDQGVLTDELRARVQSAGTIQALEDVYLPFRPKRRTRATMAREKGLELLARQLFAQRNDCDPETVALSFVRPDKEVATVDDALAGARDIIAEWVSEDVRARTELRRLYARKGIFRSALVRGLDAEARQAQKYRDYFEWEEPVTRAPSHRILAMRRGENEKILSLRILGPEGECLAVLERRFLKSENAAAAQVRLAVADSFKRLLSLAMETEMRVETRQRADAEAIRVFAENLRQLLLASPLGEKPVLALDPGLRTGCKLVCLDAQGGLLHDDVIFPDRKAPAAAEALRTLCQRYHIEAIAIGNGTGGRETERFVRSLDLDDVQVVMVNEAGASVYSASPVARDEFPDHDLTVRGSVSIGRRLMDPLAELVKIDPRSIGVGQYQHDVDQTALQDSLDDVVASCVNSVGVELNSSSARLLSHVSGLSGQLAENIVAHRREHGAFRTRRQLLDVPRLGPRAFEQAAGFLRIRGAEHPLDASAVHPERYTLVNRMAKDVGCTVQELIERAELRQRLDLDRYVDGTIGLPTLQDIVGELARPGRDPREQFEAFEFMEGVERMEDLQPGMRLPGIVTNITAFGAFVDVGVHQDGLLHISQLADRYVKDPNEIVKVAQQVQVRVLSVDLARKRIALSLRKDSGAEA
ncbi:MAG TPA: Tex family protein [Candidatus Latescibacteria bacterium]|nr:Tex family protein [Candidatus Latescibacterota bacterium]HJP30617.1 Tex family protein [Candidatus Latescibacterota bacterium]